MTDPVHLPVTPTRAEGYRRRRTGLRLTVLAAALLAGVPGAQAGGEAHLRVSDRAVAGPVAPFAATLGRLGNGADMIRGSTGFEPVIFRNWITATEDAPDRVVGSPETVAFYDTLAPGALDGAEVSVMRIENGVMRRVVRARIPEGGFHASGWRDALANGKMLPGTARSHLHAWDAYNRPAVPYHFTLRAVDAQGRLSSRSAPVTVTAPETIPRRRGRNAGLKRRPGSEDGAEEARLPAPRIVSARLTPDGKLALDWEADGDPAGFVIEQSDTAPETHRGYWFALEPRPGDTGPVGPIRAGDFVQVSRTFHTASRNALSTNRVWGAGAPRAYRPRTVDFFSDEDPDRSWALRPHAPDTPVTDPGETYLEVTLDRGAEVSIGTATHGGSAQDYYPVLQPGKTYAVEAWLRADRPMRVDFTFGGAGADLLAISPRGAIPVDTEWQLRRVTVTPSAVTPGADIGRLMLTSTGPGRLHIDNFRMYEEGVPFLELTPSEAERLRASGMAALRTHSIVKTGNHTYDLTQLTAPAGAGLGRTLPVLLDEIAGAGADAWLQIEPHFTPEEWLGLVEYLAAPWDPATDSAATKPWAARRVAQGRVDPWIDAFDRIYLEIGNETWNKHMEPWISRPLVDAATGETLDRAVMYGLLQEHVWQVLRSSPYWDGAGLEERITGVLGGLGPVPGYGRMAAAAAPSAPLLTLNAYLGGWEAGTEIAEEDSGSFFRLLTHPIQIDRAHARRQVAQMAVLAREQGRAPLLGTYEAGPGYQMNGLNGRRVSDAEAAAQERVMKSVASGTATLDAFLLRAEMGYTLQTYFTFGDGPRWTSHTRPQEGGLAHPAWMLLSLFNTQATGTMLEVETLATPTAPLPAYRRNIEAVAAAPLVTAYATREGDRLAVFVLSRRVPGTEGAGEDGVTAVTLDLPISGAAGLRHFTLTGDYTAHNLDGEAVRLVETALPVPEDASRLDIPALAPGTTQLYVFDGVRMS